MSFSNQSNLGAYLETALEKLHQSEHFDEYLEYLNSEWYYTADDLRLACEDPKVWEGIKLPGRLKIELSKLLLQPLEQQEYGESVKGINSSTNFDESTKTLQDDDVHNSWVKCWAEDHNCYYFYNTVTEESSWEDPHPDSHEPYDIYLYSDEQKRWVAIDDPYRSNQDYGMEANPFSISAKPTPQAFPRVPFFGTPTLAAAAADKKQQLEQQEQQYEDYKQHDEDKQSSSTFTKPRMMTRGNSSQDVLFVKSPNRLKLPSNSEHRQENRQEHKQNYYYTDKRKNSREPVEAMSAQDTTTTTATPTHSTPTHSSTLLARRAKRSTSSNSKSKVIRLNTYAVSTSEDSESSGAADRSKSGSKNGSKNGSKSGNNTSAPNSGQKKQLSMSAVSKDEAKERHSPMNSRPLSRPVDLNLSTSASTRTEGSSKKTASGNVSLSGAEAKSSPPKRAYRRHPSHMYDWDSKTEALVEAPTPSTLWSQASNADSTEQRPASAAISTVGSAVNSIKDSPGLPITTAVARDLDSDSASEPSPAATSLREQNASPPAATSSREDYDFYKDYDDTHTDLPLREGYGAYADGTDAIQSDERPYATEGTENNNEYAYDTNNYYNYDANTYDANFETGRDTGNEDKAEQYKQDYYDYKQQYDNSDYGEYDNSNTNEYGEYDNNNTNEYDEYDYNNTNEYGEYDYNNTNEYGEYDYNNYENSEEYEPYWNANTGQYEPRDSYDAAGATATVPRSAQQVEQESLYYHHAEPSAPPAPLVDGCLLESDSPVGHHYIATPGRTAATPHVPQLHLRSGGDSRNSSQRDRDSSRQSFTPPGSANRRNRESKSASPNVRNLSLHSPIATPIQHAHDESFYLAEAALANSSDGEVQRGGTGQYNNNSSDLMNLAMGSPPPSQHTTPTTGTAGRKKVSKKNRITQLFRLNLFGKGPAVPSTPPPPRDNTHYSGSSRNSTSDSYPTDTTTAHDKYKNRPLPQPNTKTAVSHSPRVEKQDKNIRSKPKPDDINSDQAIKTREKYFHNRSHLLPLRYGTGTGRTAYASKAEEVHCNNIQRLQDHGYTEHNSILALNMCEGDYQKAKRLLEEEH